MVDDLYMLDKWGVLKSYLLIPSLEVVKIMLDGSSFCSFKCLNVLGVI